MCNFRFKTLLAGLVLAFVFETHSNAQSSPTRPTDPADSSSTAVQATSLIDREMTIQSEQRIELLWSKYFDVQIQILDVQARIEDLDNRLTPENIQRQLWFVGSARPMDEWRAALQTKLEADKLRATKVLEMLTSTRDRLEAAIRDVESERERSRQKSGSHQ